MYTHRNPLSICTCMLGSDLALCAICVLLLDCKLVHWGPMVVESLCFGGEMLIIHVNPFS